MTQMREEYDFSEACPNPYVRPVKKAVSIRLDVGTIDYFKQCAGEVGIPYQTLINMYLAECAASRRKPSLTWS